MMLSARDLQANCKAVQAAVKAAKTAYGKWFLSNKLVQTFDAWGWGSGFAADDESGQSELENERSDMSRYKIVDIAFRYNPGMLASESKLEKLIRAEACFQLLNLCGSKILQVRKYTECTDVQ